MVDFNNMKIRRDGFNLRGMIDGDDFVFRGANLQYDNAVLIEFNELQVRTTQARTNVDKIFGLISDAVEAMAVADERYERYSTALSFCNVIRVILRNGPQAALDKNNAQQLTVETVKITIDVAKEVVLTQMDDSFSRTMVKGSAFTAKKLLDWLNNADL